MTKQDNRRDLLIVWHSRTGGAEAMAAAARDGALEQDGASCRLLRAEEAMPGDLLAAGALLVVCPENLAAMTGAMKEFFDRCYYPVLGRIEGLAYATAIAAGSDGDNATQQIDRIATGWRLRRVADPLICNFHAQTPEEILAPKQLDDADRTRCTDLGAALAAGLAMGVF
ncbi:flavodoxin family protein [Croceicoccus sp. Ery15]|uniref:flavodoxin family protein n=1 Tax=Croceicoccus sp. Ery15 TaxID=1703338 RepID=UPI001E2E0E8C|nr:flavodoxin family protein [Croceicoccus sp. Ery15]